MQTRHQPVGGEGEVGRHLKHFVLMVFGDRYQSAVDGLQPGLHMAEQHFTGVGQFDATVDAVEQTGSELLFEALDLLADSGLCRAQFEGCRGEATQARRDLKCTQQVE